LLERALSKVEFEIRQLDRLFSEYGELVRLLLTQTRHQRNSSIGRQRTHEGST
jgi:hypothetical protein